MNMGYGNPPSTPLRLPDQEVGRGVEVGWYPFRRLGWESWKGQGCGQMAVEKPEKCLF